MTNSRISQETLEAALILSRKSTKNHGTYRHTKDDRGPLLLESIERTKNEPTDKAYDSEFRDTREKQAGCDRRTFVYVWNPGVKRKNLHFEK
jgi:hypothetical protein